MSHAYGKKHISVITIGDVNSGKSTLCGRLLYELGGMSDRDLNKLSIEATNLCNPSKKYAFLMDRLPNERLLGCSIQCTPREFFTESYHYTLLDAPGNRKYIKNIIRGISQADVAIVVVSAAVSNNRPKSHETLLLVSGYVHSFNSNFPAELQSIVVSFVADTAVTQELLDYLRICHTYGMKQLIVCVNKMDDISVKYDQTIFEDIKSQIQRKLKHIGYNHKTVAFIPISAFNGYNLLYHRVNGKELVCMKWYKGFTVKRRKENITGLSLIDALETVIKPPKRTLKKPFIMPIRSVLRIKGVGDVITGRVEQGTISPGTQVTIYPKKQIPNIFSIEMHYKSIESGMAGDTIGINCKNLHRHYKLNMPKVGHVLFDTQYASSNYCCAKSFTALVFVPYSLKSKLKIGENMLVWIRTARALCTIVSIPWKQRQHGSKNEKIEFSKYIEHGYTGEINFQILLDNKIVMFPFNDCKPFGRAVFMCQNLLVMIGKVLAVSDTNCRNIQLNGVESECCGCLKCDRTAKLNATDQKTVYNANQNMIHNM